MLVFCIRSYKILTNLVHRILYLILCFFQIFDTQILTIVCKNVLYSVNRPIDIILPAALWSWCRILPSYDYQVRWYFIDKVHTYVYSVTIGSKSQSIEYLLPDGEMSTRQEVGVINVKYHCHKVTGTLSSKSPSVADAIVAPVDSKLYPDLCITRDCFLILMLRTF